LTRAELLEIKVLATMMDGRVVYDGMGVRK